VFIVTYALKLPTSRLLARVDEFALGTTSGVIWGAIRQNACRRCPKDLGSCTLVVYERPMVRYRCSQTFVNAAYYLVALFVLDPRPLLIVGLFKLITFLVLACLVGFVVVHSPNIWRLVIGASISFRRLSPRWPSIGDGQIDRRCLSQFQMNQVSLRSFSVLHPFSRCSPS
jgi:hypothetical protein